MTIRYKRPDVKNADSIVDAAKREMSFVLSIEINEKSSSTVIKNIYECFRMLGDAILVANGKTSKDHTEQIKALMRIKVNTPRPLQLLDNIRMLRHNLSYYGYRPSREEAEDIVDFAKKCFSLTYEEVIKEIKK